MTLSERISKWYHGERDKLRPMSFRQKVSYIAYYYKLWFIGFLVLALFVWYIGDVIVQSHKETLLQGFIVNDLYDLFDTGEMEDEFGGILGVGKNQRIIFDGDLYVDFEGRDARDYSAASNGKIIAYIATAELDFVIATEKLYDHYSENVPLLDFKQLLPADLYTRLEEYMIPALDADGKPIDGGLNMEHCRFMEGREHEDVNYYMFVPLSAPDNDALCRFIEWCFPSA